MVHSLQSKQAPRTVSFHKWTTTWNECGEVFEKFSPSRPNHQPSYSRVIPVLFELCSRSTVPCRYQQFPYLILERFLPKVDWSSFPIPHPTIPYLIIIFLDIFSSRLLFRWSNDSVFGMAVQTPNAVPVPYPTLPYHFDALDIGVVFSNLS